MKEFEELAKLLGAEEEELYQEMRRGVMDEIAFREMAVTVIMRDLIEIRHQSPRHADIIEYAVASPFCSYEELARIGGVSKQAIFSQMRKYARSYPWIAGLIQIRTIQNTRGVPDPEDRKRIRKVLTAPIQPELHLDDGDLTGRA
nr:MAG TPA: MarR family [Caudoviricetes sp.]